jgi:hypothetical protein
MFFKLIIKPKHMKKNNYSITFLMVLFSMGVNAQVILTKSSWPSVGKVKTANFYEPVSEGSSGNNVTWDFSDIVKRNIPVSQSEYVNSSSTPFASEFANSNQAWGSQGSFQYYLVDNNGVSIVGQGVSSQGATSVAKYDNYQKIISFPFSYQSSLDDNFSGTLVNTSGGQSAPYVRKGNTKTMADGQGTIILPGGKSYPALRIKAEQQIEDKFEFLSEEAETHVISITNSGSVSYSWFIPEHQGEIVTIVYSYSGSTSIIDGDTFSLPPIDTSITMVGYDLELTSVSGRFLEGNSFTVSPNPVENSGVISVNSTISETAAVNIKSMEGSLVKTLGNMNFTLGGTDLVFDCAELAAGIYFVELVTDDNKAIRKLVKK